MYSQKNVYISENSKDDKLYNSAETNPSDVSLVFDSTNWNSPIKMYIISKKTIVEDITSQIVFETTSIDESYNKNNISNFNLNISPGII